MKRFAISAALVLLFIVTAHAQDVYEGDNSTLECTSIVVGRKASADGSVITSHTCDGVSHTWVSIEKAADHKAGAMTPLRKNWRKTLSRADVKDIKVVGEIPQVPHTFSYLNTGYPSMNEKQVGIGETTFGGPDTLINRDSPLLIEELARLALERCATAREAVALMGSLAEQYGYGDGGECLTVADPSEVWQFEITGNGKHATGAIWAAQRIPDGHVGISANIPRIGRIDRSDSANFMASDNVEKVCLEHGLWDGESEFIFWKAIKCDYARGKNFREREFYVFRALAPSLGLTYDMAELPFSVKPDSLVDVRKVMELLRNDYAGSEFDMCRNWLINVPEKDGVPAHKEVSPLANPWLTTPMRNTLNTIAPGTIEFTRTLAVAWCSYSTVIQLRGWLPDAVGGICWYAVDNPGQSPRIPIFCGNTALPKAFDVCGQKEYFPDCVLWTFRRANKLATLSWQTEKKNFLKNVLEMEQMTFDAVAGAEQSYSSARNAKAKAKVLNDCTSCVFERCAQRWAEMEATYWHKFGRGF